MKKILLFLTFAFVAVVFADKYDDWLDNQVKPIITKQERDAFKKLKTDAEKEQFMKDFWAKRDPSPGTPENEFKTEYERRLAEINEKMKGSRVKPLDTDIGQAVLLLGDPIDVKKEEQKTKPSANVGGSDEEENAQAPATKQTWTFGSIPTDVAPGGQVVLQFEGPNFSDKKKAEDILEKARQHAMSAPSMAQKAPAAGGKQQTEGAQKAAPATAAMAPVTTPALKTALDAVAAGNVPKDIVVHFTADTFMTSTGESFVPVLIHAPDVTAGKAGIRILNASGTMVKETELALPSSDEKPGYLRTVVDLTPGDYTVVVAVNNGDKSGGGKKNLTMPDFSSALGMSTILLTKEVTPLTESAPEKVAYSFGKNKVYPSFDHTFTKTDEIIIIYEVYNFAVNPTTGKPDLEASVTFTMGQSHPTQTYELPGQNFFAGKRMVVAKVYPLADLHPGTWAVKMTTKDKTNNATVTRESEFTLVEK